jgi:hypothetical protein
MEAHLILDSARRRVGNNLRTRAFSTYSAGVAPRFCFANRMKLLTSCE